MNYPTITNAITPSSWFFNLYYSKSKNDNSTSSKLETLFLLDSGGSISALNLPTYTILAEKILHCSSEIHPSPSKTTTVANKAQVPILFNNNLTCHTSINTDSHTFNIPFAVANVKYNILGTPFFEQYVKSLDFENMALLFKDTPNSRFHSIPFAAHKEKDYPFYSYIYTINVSINLIFQPNSSKAIFLLNPQLLFPLKLLKTKLYYPLFLIHIFINASTPHLVSFNSMIQSKPPLHLHNVQ